MNTVWWSDRKRVDNRGAMTCCYREDDHERRSSRNGGRCDESPDVGLDEKVGERLVNPFSTRIWQPPKYEHTKTEMADRTNEPSKKKWFALVVDFPMVTGCKYQSKKWVALE